MDSLSFPRQTTAVMFIDMQNSIAGHEQFQPVVKQCQRLLETARAHRVPVVFVHVRPYDHVKHSMRGEAQALLSRPGANPADPHAFDIIGALPVLPEDHVVTKHVRSAFTGTEMDHLLRAMAVSHVVIGGIATNIGVESTVRVGADLGYNFTVVEDACAAMTPEAHLAAITYSLPYFARIAKLADLQFRD